MANYLEIAAELRKGRQEDQARRTASLSSGGAATSSGGMVGQPQGSTQGGYSQPQQVQQPDYATNALNLASKYNQVSNGGLNRMVAGGGGGATFAGATPATMSAMGAGGGSSLGSMGLMGGGSAVSFPGASTAASTGGAGGAGALGAGGMLAGLAGLSYLGDKEMNENKGSIINADKLNNAGTIGGSGIGFRAGDLVNGFNPATWLSDPKKAGKGLANAFTFGLADKVFDLF